MLSLSPHCHATQVRQLQQSLRESESNADELRARLAACEEQCVAERSAAAVASKAAGSSERHAKMAEELRAQLQAAKADIVVCVCLCVCVCVGGGGVCVCGGGV